jgi:hypothetical protein
VTALRLNVTALDCPTQDARPTDCDIVGRSVGTFDANIPAGEVWQINGKVTLRGVPKTSGVFLPRFAVSGVRAPIDQSDDMFTPGGPDDPLMQEFFSAQSFRCDSVMR